MSNIFLIITNIFHIKVLLYGTSDLNSGLTAVDNMISYLSTAEVSASPGVHVSLKK